jgi:hypothetical protein
MIDYITVDIKAEFPSLWSEFIKERSGGIIGTSAFHTFLKTKKIDGFARISGPLGEAHIRRDHLMWLRLKY